ncbi:hypothetical protein AN403_5257 [Pseudomonas fluorescens]|uniref:Uncharacterized protein n=1 Tax=Pseudomonas fluorescens TaxID=294 RepID=A0A0P9BDG1_PSEFL|nr:hypothetical protein AN403_5257 [Pseudomonas fluorescens]
MVRKESDWVNDISPNGPTQYRRQHVMPFNAKYATQVILRNHPWPLLGGAGGLLISYKKYDRNTTWG